MGVWEEGPPCPVDAYYILLKTKSDEEGCQAGLAVTDNYLAGRGCLVLNQIVY